MNAPLHGSAVAAAPGEAVPEWQGAIYDGQRTTYGFGPAAWLRATAEELVLCGDRAEYHLPRGRIWKVTRGDFFPWLFTSVQIHHGIPQYPNEIQFKPSQTTLHAVLAQLRELGYPVV